MSRLIELITKFCEENNNKYELYDKDCVNSMCGKNCYGILVKGDFSYMEMLGELTGYLDNVDLNDKELEFSEGILIEEVDTEYMVCFPNLF